MSTTPSIYDQYRQSVAALPPPPTPNLAGMAGPTSPGGVPSNLNIPMPTSPNVTEAPTQLQKDQQHYQDIKMKGPGEEQIYHAISGSKLGQNHPILGKVLGGLAAGVTGAADIGVGTLGGGIGRLAEEQIPGTLLNHQVQLNRAGKDITTDEANAGKEAQTASENATAAETGARQKQTEETTAEMPGKATDTHALTESEIGEHNAQAANLLHPQAKTDFEAWQAQNPGKPIEQWLQAQSAAKPKSLEQRPLMDPTTKQPYMGTFNPATGKYTDPSGKEIVNPVPYERPMSVNVDSNRAFQEAERGRGLLDKAEGQYRTAEQGAQGIRAMIDDALQGGKISAKMLPLEGALEVTTANGVKRINRTEVDQYAGGGSLFDQLAGKLRGATSGIPFTNEIMNDMKRLADLQEKGAYDNYKGGYDSATRRYHLSDEQPLPAPGGSGQPSGLAVSLADARQLSQNKGKSDAQITADIKAHGHEVRP